MAIALSKNSNLNNDLWKDTDVALRVVMQDTDNEMSGDDELVKAMFNVEKSKQFAEKSSGMTEFGDMVEVEEGAAAPLDDVQQDFSKQITHHTFMKQFVCTKEAQEDMRINDMKIASANFIKSYKRARAVFATNALVTEGTTFTYGAKSYDKTAADDLALFSTAHLAKRSGVATQSNVFTNEIGSTAVMLYTLANYGRNFKNSSGQVQAATFDTVIIPGNRPVMENLLKTIVSSELTVGSAYNDKNTQKGLWKIIVNKRWIAASGQDPYIIASSEANKALQAAMFYDRVILDVTNQVDINTRNLVWNGRARFGCGFNNWRAFILGGAASGTTLS